MSSSRFLAGTARRRLPAAAAVGSLLLSLTVAAVVSPLSGTARADATGLSVTKAVVDFDGQATGGTVTVDQTTDLRDQVLHVTWDGLHPSLDKDSYEAVDQLTEPYVFDDAGEPLDASSKYAGKDPTTALRTVAVLQCWGSDPTRDNCLTLTRPNSVGVGNYWVNPADYYEWVKAHPDLDPNVFFPAEGAIWDGRESPAEVARLGLDPRTTGLAQPANFPFTTRSNRVYPNGDVPDISGYGDSASDNRRNGVTGADGKGSVDIEVYTKESAPSLGCDAAHACSLVVVPLDLMTRVWSPQPEAAQYFKDNPAHEVELGPGTFLGYPSAEVSSGLTSMEPTRYFSASNWARRIVFPLGFVDDGGACPLGGEQVQSAGNEQTAEVITAWQRPLCNGKGAGEGQLALSLNHSVQSDTQAAGSFARGSTDLAVVRNAALDKATKRAPELAPLAASGVTFVWTDERVPWDTTVNLTPRLMAKLLTESYGGADWDPNTPTAAGSLEQDQDYLQFNPAATDTSNIPLTSTASPLLVFGESSAIGELWEWILADPDAAAWVNGAADEWGMTINSTWRGYEGGQEFEHRDPAVCPAATVVDFAGCGLSGGPTFVSAAIFAEAMKAVVPRAQVSKVVGTQDVAARRVARGTQTAASFFDRLSLQDVTPEVFGWKTRDPDPVGVRSELAFSNSATAARYRLRTVALQNSSGKFVQPTVTALVHAVNAAVQDPDTGAWSVPVTVADPLAYPVTDISHAEVATSGMTTTAAAKIATVLDWAAGKGQLLGPEAGSLPKGYVPLPAKMQQQTRRIAADVRAQAGALTLQAISGVTPSPTPSATPTVRASATPTPTKSASPTPTSSTSKAATPSAAPTAASTQPTPSKAAPTPTPKTVSESPSPSPSSTRKATPTPSPSSSRRGGVGGGSGNQGTGATGAGARPTTGSAATLSPSAGASSSGSSEPAVNPSAAGIAEVQTVAAQAETAGPMRFALMLVLLLGLAGAVASQVVAFRANGKSLPSLPWRRKTK